MIIVLSGGKQHGKDTFAEIFIKQFPRLNFKRKAFADKMKEVAANLLDCEYDEIETLKVLEDIKITDEACIRQGTTMRKFLQRLGQIVKDITNDDYIWCELLSEDMTAGSNYIITDCRFPFEAQYLKDLANSYGVPVAVVKIHNPHVELGKDQHVSEQSFEQIEFDYIVENDGSLEDLQVKAIKLVDKFLKGF